MGQPPAIANHNLVIGFVYIIFRHHVKSFCTGRRIAAARMPRPYRRRRPNAEVICEQKPVLATGVPTLLWTEYRYIPQ